MSWLWLWKMILVVAVTLIPGSFVLLLAYITTRTVWARWRQVQAESRTRGVPVSVWAVVGSLHFKELVRQARTAF